MTTINQITIYHKEPDSDGYSSYSPLLDNHENKIYEIQSKNRKSTERSPINITIDLDSEELDIEFSGFAIYRESSELDASLHKKYLE